MIIFLFLGLVSCLFQLVLLREFTFSIAKNEFSLILAVGFWIIFSSLGSLISIKKKIVPANWIPALLACFFCFNISGVHLAKILFGIRYFENTPLIFTILFTTLFIGTQSLLCGYAFGIFCQENLKNQKQIEKHSTQFFAFEGLGIFLGSVGFSLIFSRYTNPFLFSFLSWLLIPAVKSKPKKILTFVFIGFMSLSFLFLFPHILTKEFDNAHILSVEGTPYGPEILTEKNSVYGLYINGVLAQTSEDQALEEELIHTAFSSTSKHEDVLLVGRFSKNHQKEISKYNPQGIHAVWFTPVKNNIPYTVDDPRRYLEKSEKKYDIILMNIMAPKSLSANRFYTLEFFKLVQQRLKKDGVLVFSLPSKRDILSPSFLDFNSSIINTLLKVFPSSLFIPGDTMIVFASIDNPLQPQSFIDRFLVQNIKTQFFTVYHLKEALSPSRRNFLRSQINQNILINQDFSPFGFLYYLLLEQKKTSSDFTLPVHQMQKIIPLTFLFFIFLLSLLSIFNQKKWAAVHAACFGFLSIGTSTLIYIIFQVVSGTLYWKLGILIGTFMLGLSTLSYLESLKMEKIYGSPKRIGLLYVAWLLVMFFLLAITYAPGNPAELQVLLYFVSFFAGGLTGLGYPLLVKILSPNIKDQQTVPVFINIVDLIGTFLGTICFSIFFIPFLGITTSILLSIALISIFGLKNLWR